MDDETVSINQKKSPKFYTYIARHVLDVQSTAGYIEMDSTCYKVWLSGLQFVY